jgi:hypothetical protein
MAERRGAEIMKRRLMMVRSLMVGVCAMACSLAATASGQTQSAGGLSDKSVNAIMTYAWQVLPSKFTAPNGKVIEVDKKKQEGAIVPIETARDVIRVGYNSAQAQVCEMWEAQSANFDTLMRVENAKKKWNDQQMLYITTLHRMTIHVVSGKIRVVDEKGELKVFLEPIEPSKEACPDEKRKKVADAIEAYVKANNPAATAAPTNTVQQQSQPTTTSSTTPKKK